MTAQDARAGYISSQTLGSTHIFSCGYCLPESFQQRTCLASTMSEVRRPSGSPSGAKDVGRASLDIRSACSEIKSLNKRHCGPSGLASERTPGSGEWPWCSRLAVRAWGWGVLI